MNWCRADLKSSSGNLPFGSSIFQYFHCPKQVKRLLHHNVSLYHLPNSNITIAKGQINLPGLAQGRMHANHLQAMCPLVVAPSFSVFMAQNGHKEGCSSTMLLCIICQIPTASIGKVKIHFPRLTQWKVQVLFRQLA